MLLFTQNNFLAIVMITGLLLIIALLIRTYRCRYLNMRLRKAALSKYQQEIDVKNFSTKSETVLTIHLQLI
jgi:hypothetical protein